MLTLAGEDVQQLPTRDDDPPDCEAVIRGLRCGIEVTELLDQQTLESTNTGGRAAFGLEARHVSRCVAAAHREKGPASEGQKVVPTPGTLSWCIRTSFTSAGETWTPG